MMNKVLRYSKLNLISHLLPREKSIYLLITLLFVLLAAISNVAAPILLKGLIDHVSNGASWNNVSFLFIAFAMTLAIGRICLEIKFVIYSRWEQTLLRRSFGYLYQCAQKNIPSFYREQKAGEISGRIYQGILGLKVLLFDCIAHLSPLLIEFILIISSVTYIFNIEMSLVISIGILSYLGCLLFTTKHLLSNQAAVRETSIKSQGTLTQLFDCWQDIKLFNAYNRSADLLARDVDLMAKEYSHFYARRSLFGVIQMIPLIITFVYANYIAILGYITHHFSLGSLVLINSYIFQLMKPLETFGVLYRTISRAWSDFSGLSGIQSFRKEKFSDDFSELTSINTIEINNLTVPGVLKNVNLSVHAGDKVAIIGESGAGKSTLFNVLTGLETNYQGDVLINGINLRDIPVNKLRRDIVYLNAESNLVDASVFDNIMLSDFSNDTCIQYALQSVYLKDKLSSFPNGLEELINENKVNLSTGEKQRVKIARLYTQPSTVRLCDEITASLDPELKIKIITKILESSSIILFITHDMELLPYFDRVIELKDNVLKQTVNNINYDSNKGQLVNYE